MGDLTPNFSRTEFACKCGCGFDDIHLDLVKNLQTLRDHFQKPIHINSGCRCSDWNKKSGSTNPNSQHIQGKAADIHMEGITPQEIARFAATLEVFRKGGIGVYDTFVHLDVRNNGPARWGNPWKKE